MFGSLHLLDKMGALCVKRADYEWFCRNRNNGRLLTLGELCFICATQTILQRLIVSAVDYGLYLFRSGSVKEQVNHLSVVGDDFILIHQQLVCC